MTPEQRSLRSRIAAHSRHAQGRTNTEPARRGFRLRFEREVDPDMILPPAERAERAEAALRAHMSRLALKRRRPGSRVAAST